MRYTVFPLFSQRKDQHAHLGRIHKGLSFLFIWIYNCNSAFEKKTLGKCTTVHLVKQEINFSFFLFFFLSIFFLTMIHVHFRIRTGQKSDVCGIWKVGGTKVCCDWGLMEFLSPQQMQTSWGSAWPVAALGKLPLLACYVDAFILLTDACCGTTEVAATLPPGTQTLMTFSRHLFCVLLIREQVRFEGSVTGQVCPAPHDGHCTADLPSGPTARAPASFSRKLILGGFLFWPLHQLGQALKVQISLRLVSVPESRLLSDC